MVAWLRVRANRASRSAGVDGQTARHIEQELGVQKFLDGLREELRSGTFRPLPVRERYIPIPRETLRAAPDVEAMCPATNRRRGMRQTLAGARDPGRLWTRRVAQSTLGKCPPLRRPPTGGARAAPRWRSRDSSRTHQPCFARLTPRVNAPFQDSKANSGNTAERSGVIPRLGRRLLPCLAAPPPDARLQRKACADAVGRSLSSSVRRFAFEISERWRPPSAC